MAQTYSLIQAQTLTGNSTSITFSNIPQNFNDLAIVISGRSDRVASEDSVRVTLGNNTIDSGNNYSHVAVYQYDNTVYSENSSSTSSILWQSPVAAASTTSNTFDNSLLYLRNYTLDKHKTLEMYSAAETNGNSALNGFSGGRWASTSAINIITLAPRYGTNFIANTTVYLYGIGGARATGGTITADSTYTYHTFTSSGTFVSFENIKNAEVLVIGGGGAGGGNFGGGGGAGGVCYHPAKSLTAGNSYMVIVGAGATAGVSYAGNDGNLSLFGDIIANGGGGGGGSDTGTNAGRSGGSGGGANRGAAGGSATQTNSGGAIGYGNAGASSSNGFQSGGGGGSGTAGLSGTGTNDATSKGGNGGDGLNNWSAWATATGTGVLGYYAAGGGGSCRTSSTLGGGLGGAGGGGAGGKGPANGGTAATANTGSGGGAGTDDVAATGNGGSGLVIVRYPN